MLRKQSAATQNILMLWYCDSPFHTLSLVFHFLFLPCLSSFWKITILCPCYLVFVCVFCIYYSSLVLLLFLPMFMLYILPMFMLFVLLSLVCCSCLVLVRAKSMLFSVCANQILHLLLLLVVVAYPHLGQMKRVIFVETCIKGKKYYLLAWVDAAAICPFPHYLAYLTLTQHQLGDEHLKQQIPFNSTKKEHFNLTYAYTLSTPYKQF